MVEWYWQGKPENSKNLSHCHFAQKKFRMGWPEIQTELLRWEAVHHLCALECSVRNFYMSFPVGNMKRLTLRPSRLTFLFSGWSCHAMPHVIDCNILRRKKWVEIEWGSSKRGVSPVQNCGLRKSRKWDCHNWKIISVPSSAVSERPYYTVDSPERFIPLINQQ